MNNVSLSLKRAGSSPLVTSLGRYADAGLYARFDNQFGSGGIYYVENSMKSFTDVVASLPAGAPTPTGLLIDGSVAPTLVPGYGDERVSNSGGPFLSTTSFSAEHGANVSVVAGALRIAEADGGSGSRAVCPIVTTIGETIKLSAVVKAVGGGGGGGFIGVSNVGDGTSMFAIGSTATPGNISSVEFVATATTTFVVLIGAGQSLNSYIDFETCSAKPVLPPVGFSGTDQTVAITWDANGVTGDRVLWEARKDANDRIPLHFVSGILRLETFIGGVSQGFVAVPGVDDGGAHSAVLYMDGVTGTLALRVDDRPVTGPELWTSAAVLGIQDALGSAGAYDQGTQTMSVPDNGGNTGYPRFGFDLLTAGLTYQVIGRLTGQLASNAVRLATSGSTAYIDYDSGTGVFSGVQEAETNILQFMTPGALGPWSTQIVEMSVKATSTRTGLMLPEGILTVDIGHSQGANPLNGLVIEFAAATGDLRDVW